MAEVRLNKYLAEAGVASRRKADELIRAGRVTVDGAVVKEVGQKVDPERQEIAVDGKPVRPAPKVYYLFYKPAGYLTALSDPHGRPTIASFLKRLPYRVFPVGRLDADTEGLLLLTNDGELANRLLHPRYGIKRLYEATVKGHPSPAAIKRLLEEGIEVEGRRVYPKAIRLKGKGPHTSTYEVVVGEGRKREVRKLFASIGHPVLKLKRLAFGPLALRGLRPGEIRPLSPKELRTLRKVLKV
ncbi:MAG: rRNA pseudouridine synthase [Thermodesulfobacteria bacterium]|nr:rRNA pseudouridine synthase [Thermodesulfobacteriota bacterium]